MYGIGSSLLETRVLDDLVCLDGIHFESDPAHAIIFLMIDYDDGVRGQAGAVEHRAINVSYYLTVTSML